MKLPAAELHPGRHFMAARAHQQRFGRRGPPRPACAEHRPLLFTPLLLALVLAGCTTTCGDPTATTRPPNSGECITSSEVESTQCQRNVDCGTGALCEKAEGAGVSDFGCCLQVFCLEDIECGPDAYCNTTSGACFNLPECPGSGPADLPCDPLFICGWDNEGAMCVLPEAPATCEIWPPRIVTTHNAAVSFGVFAQDARGQPLAFTVQNAETDLTATVVDNTLTAQCDGDETCTGTLSIDVGNVRCSAEVEVVPASGEKTIRLIDEQSGAALTGDIYAVTSDGATLFSDVADVALPAAFPLRAVTVMVDGYHWQTLLRPPEGPVIVPLRKVDQGGSAAVGEISYAELPPLGDIPHGVAGVSIRRPLHQMRRTDLFGPSRRISTNLTGVGTLELDVPTGFLFSVGTDLQQTQLLAIGAPGKRLPWSVAHRHQLTDFGRTVPNTGPPYVPFLYLWSSTGMYSGIGPTIIYEDRPPPEPQDGFAFDTWSQGDEIAPEKLAPSVQPHWSATLRLPLDGRITEAAKLLIVIGVEVAGRGFVPLSFSTMSPNENTDIFFAEDQQGTPGEAVFGFAPPHSGLENRAITALSMAYSASSNDDSFVRTHLAVARNIEVGGTNELAPGWISGPVSAYSVATDSFEVGTPPTATALFVDATRLVFGLDAGQQQWDVLVSGAPDENDALIPLLPPGERDVALELVEHDGLVLDADSASLTPATLLRLDEHVIVARSWRGE